MSGQQSGPLLDPPERTREDLDSLETRFQNVYGRDMTPEERKYFGLVEPIARFEPDGHPPSQNNADTPQQIGTETAENENPPGPESNRPKAA